MTTFPLSLLCLGGLFLALLFPVFSHGRGESPNQAMQLTPGRRIIQFSYD